jgi:hypothetical protein
MKVANELESFESEVSAQGYYRFMQACQSTQPSGRAEILHVQWWTRPGGKHKTRTGFFGGMDESRRMRLNCGSVYGPYLISPESVISITKIDPTRFQLFAFDLVNGVYEMDLAVQALGQEVDPGVWIAPTGSA